MLKNIISSPSREAIAAVGFVTDVFEEMVLQFRKCVTLNRIASDDPFLSSPVAYRAYISPQNLYENYKNIFFNEVALYFTANNVHVQNFEEFIQIFRSIAHELARTVRFTFPGFVKSRECPILCSGLAIEIAPHQDAANDNSKVTKFIQSKNWDFFVNTCDTYGFMIDYNVPWRIVADIDSEIMRQIASRYGYVNPYDLLGRGYHSAAPNYLVVSLRRDMYELYNLVRSDYWVDTQTCDEFYTGVKGYSSTTYSAEEFEARFGFYYFLELYLFLRLCEEQPKTSTQHKQRLIDDVIRVVKSDNDTVNPLIVFERIINKEFDKVGSSSYIKEATKLKKEAAFSKGERNALRVSDINDIPSY